MSHINIRLVAKTADEIIAARQGRKFSSKEQFADIQGFYLLSEYEIETIVQRILEFFSFSFPDGQTTNNVENPIEAMEITDLFITGKDEVTVEVHWKYNEKYFTTTTDHHGDRGHWETAQIQNTADTAFSYFVITKETWEKISIFLQAAITYRIYERQLETAQAKAFRKLRRLLMGDLPGIYWPKEPPKPQGIVPER